MALPRPKPGSVFVRVGSVPRFKVLSDIDARAERESQFLLSATIRQVRRVLAEVPADPVDDILAQATEPLRQEPAGLVKSAGVFDPREPDLTRDEAVGLQLIAHELRKRHGAPVRPGGLIDGDTVPASPDGDRKQDAARAIARILAAIPFRSGHLVSGRNGAARFKGRRPKPLPELQPLPLAAATALNQDVKSADLRKVLAGDLDQVVRAIRHPAGDGFTVFDGAATWLAAKLLQLPALDVEMFEPARTQRADPPAVPPHDLSTDLRAAMHHAAQFAYRVPPVLEPLAELARGEGLRTFDDAYHGRAGDEEVVARRRADMLSASRDGVWIAIYRANRMAQITDDVARRRAINAPEFRRANSTWRGAERTARRAEEAGHAVRDAYRLAKAQVLSTARALGLDYESRVVDDAPGLWFHARRGADAFSDDELVDRVPFDVADQRRASEGLPSKVSSPRFPNRPGMDGTPEGAPALYLRAPEPDPDRDRETRGAHEDPGAPPFEPRLVLSEVEGRDVAPG